jgi:DNA mismatch repair protein MutS
VIPGTSDHSFGIHVAKMAGLPPSIISRASQLLKEMEGENHSMEIAPITAQNKQESAQMSIFEIRDDSIRRSLQDLDLNKLTPIQAFEHLLRLKNEADSN